MDKKRVALYVRAETEEKAEAQESHLRLYAETHPDWEIRKVFTDKGDGHKKRLALQALDAEIGERRYDLVLTASMDRLSRDIDKATHLLAAWKDCGAAVVQAI